MDALKERDIKVALLKRIKNIKETTEHGRLNTDDSSIIIDSLANRTIEIEVQHALDVISLMLKKYDSHLTGTLSEADKKFVKGFNIDVYL